MRATSHKMRFAAALATVALVAAACGSDDDTSSDAGDDAVTTEAPSDDSTPAGDDDAGDDAGDDAAADGTCETAINDNHAVASLAELEDFSGMEFNVGSKDFIEQFVLGNLAIVGLEAAGATVTDSTNLGGTVVNRDAMLAGQVDMYFDYNGTGWTNFLAQDDPSFDGDQLTNDVCVQDLEENDVRWIGVSPFNNTYGFATASDSPAAGGDLQAMMEYVNENADATVCMETEYPNRPDGLVLLEEATGLTIPDGQSQILDTGVIYDETASGNCTFGEIFTTDGRIPALGLEVVEDPGVHVIYNVSLTMKDEVFQQAPEAFEALADTIFDGLDNAKMAELNQRVTDGEEAKAVATDYLTEKGVL